MNLLKSVDDRQKRKAMNEALLEKNKLKLKGKSREKNVINFSELIINEEKLKNNHACC